MSTNIIRLILGQTMLEPLLASVRRRTAIFCAFAASMAAAQTSNLPLAHLDVGPHDPLYTTYAAPLARSEYFVDEGYFLNYFTPDQPVTYSTDTAGSFGLLWRLDDDVAVAIKDFYRTPVIRRSLTDSVETEYWPFRGVEVHERFVVYSSRYALLEIEIINHRNRSARIDCAITYGRDDSVTNAAVQERQSVTFMHHVDPKTWSETPHPQFDPDLRDIVLLSQPAKSWAGFPVANAAAEAFGSRPPLSGPVPSELRSFALVKSLALAAGEKVTFRVVRGVQPSREDQSKLLSDAKALVSTPLAPLIASSEQPYARIPRACGNAQTRRCVQFPNRDWELAYWSALTQVRQQMMPPEAEAHFNYYVFSREPTWSWGHDGQVFHESIVMQAYALMDPQSAEDSQRVFIERQQHGGENDGYIGYRVGPYVDRTFPTNGELTSSAPFFSWTNWEIYRISHDGKFLGEAYRSGAAFAEWVLRTHDPDHDGVLVWGGNAMLENVRDSLDVIWNLFGGSDDSPKRVKALDLMCMMVKETRSLAAMAGELGLPDERQKWNTKADRLADVVRTRMWDPETGFFYNLARDTRTFTTRDGISLKRKEIIGFLPLWAGIATREQAERLRRHAADPASFARRFGMPTLAADDPYYDPRITRCCQWNGAVWLLWDYMVERGLLDYGFRAEAEQLVAHAMDGVLLHLRNDHRLWESYSPDYPDINSPKNYVWDGIIARMIFDLYGKP